MENIHSIKKELESLSEEELRDKALKLYQEYRTLMEKNDKLVEKQQKTAPIFRILQSCPQSRKKVQRNSMCPCGSGLKYKKCCIKYEAGNLSQEEALAQIEETGLLDLLKP